MSGARVVVAMSGGVDSSVAAALLADQGYDVVGITLQLYDHGAAIHKKGACCAGQDIHDARRVAEQIGIDHYVLDFEGRFKQAVIDDFVDTYVAGRTPIPCVRCNQRVKFHDLLNISRDLGAEFLATGHYVRRVEGAHGPELHRAEDDTRDQSYFMFATTRAQLDVLRFPLGDQPKSETRRLAGELGLVVADKPDSQDICFVPNGHYSDLVRRMRPGVDQPGDIVHVDGRVLGRHDGVIRYTVGQRRGLSVAVGEPLYVVRIEPATRRVIVGPKQAMACRRVTLEALNWLGDDEELTAPVAVQVKHRANEPAVNATLHIEAGTSCLSLDRPEFGVAPGQAAVLYHGTRVLGGGWITQAPSLADTPENSLVAA